jgi:hypothetical protein
MMLAIAGLGERGSAAAMEFVTNPKYLAGFDERAPRGWDRRNVELVIRTKLVNEDWGEPQLTANHVWETDSLPKQCGRNPAGPALTGGN